MERYAGNEASALAAATVDLESLRFDELSRLIVRAREMHRENAVREESRRRACVQSITLPHDTLLRNPRRKIHPPTRPNSSQFWRFPERRWPEYVLYMREARSTIRCAKCDSLTCWRVLPHVKLYPMFGESTLPIIENFAKHDTARLLDLIVLMATSELVDRCACGVCAIANVEEAAVVVADNGRHQDASPAAMASDGPEALLCLDEDLSSLSSSEEGNFAFENDEENGENVETGGAHHCTGIGRPDVSPRIDASNERRLNRATEDLRLWHTANLGLLITRLLTAIECIDNSRFERELETVFERLLRIGCAALALPFGLVVSSETVTAALTAFVHRHQDDRDGGSGDAVPTAQLYLLPSSVHPDRLLPVSPPLPMFCPDRTVVCACMRSLTSPKALQSIHALAVARKIDLPTLCPNALKDYKLHQVRQTARDALATFAVDMGDGAEAGNDDSSVDSGYDGNDDRWIATFASNGGFRAGNLPSIQLARLYRRCADACIGKICDNVYRGQILYDVNSFLLFRSELYRHRNPCVPPRRAAVASEPPWLPRRRRQRSAASRRSMLSSAKRLRF